MKYVLTQQALVECREIVQDKWYIFQVCIEGEKDFYCIVDKEKADKLAKKKVFHKKNYTNTNVFPVYLKSVKLSSSQTSVSMRPAILNIEMMEHYKKSGEFMNFYKYPNHEQDYESVFKNGIQEGFSFYLSCYNNHTALDEDRNPVVGPIREYFCSSAHNMKNVRKAIELGYLVEPSKERFVPGNGDSIDASLPVDEQQYIGYKAFKSTGGWMSVADIIKERHGLDLRKAEKDYEEECENWNY